jgi:hypothetical protein
MSLTANTITADTSGNSSLPVEPVPSQPGQQLTVIPAAAVVLLGAASATAVGATLPANVPVVLPPGRYFFRAPTATVAVSYFYTSN